MSQRPARPRAPSLDTMTGEREAALGEFDRALGRDPGAAEHPHQQRAIERHDAARGGPYRPFLTPERAMNEHERRFDDTERRRAVERLHELQQECARGQPRRVRLWCIWPLSALRR